MRKKVKKTHDRIKKLKIQGATDVALAAVKSLKKIKKQDKLEEAVEYLSESRPTEPMMRNGLKFVQDSFNKGKTVKEASEEFEEIVEEAVKKIVDVGVSFIIEDATVMTHCHSSLVEKILVKAYEKNRLKKVLVTETRPLYQGRKTAKNLAKKGIPVKIGVDSARLSLLKEADIGIVGADVITSDGHIFNKIGTKNFALSAEHMVTRDFIVASQLLKIDPSTLKGKRDEIEERPKKEVWKGSPKGVEVYNPAFEAVPPEYIDYVVTEEGVLNPFNVMDNARRNYPWIFQGE